MTDAFEYQIFAYNWNILRPGEAPAEDKGEMSASVPATRRWTPDEERKLDKLLDAGKEAAEIAVASTECGNLSMRGFNGFTENERGCLSWRDRVRRNRRCTRQRANLHLSILALIGFMIIDYFWLARWG